MDAPVRVLVVDDDVDFRAMLAWQLSKADEVEVVGDAADGYDALEQIEELSPEVAVVDLVMPGMDGFELIDHMLADHPDLVPIAYSAMATEHARDQLQAIGVEMVTKSGNADRLVEALLRLAPPTQRTSAGR